MTTTTTSSTAPAGADFTQLTPIALALAAQLGIELILFPGGFGAKKGCDILAEDLMAAEIKEWLEGYLNGRDEIDAPAALHELLLAELIINTLQNILTDEQRLLVAAQLAAAGLQGSTPTRSLERRAAITAAGAV